MHDHHEHHHEHPNHHRRFGPPFGLFGGMEFGPGRGRGRARRGDVRLAVLTLLAEQPRHGYEIIRELVDRSQGAWQPSPGSVYPTLQLLEDEGLVKGVDDNGKRRFEITEEGTAYLTANARSSAPWDEMAGSVDPGRVQLFDALRHVAMATQQVVEVGSAEQRQSAVKLLSEARRQLYVLLSTEGEQPG
jgi:DNA-binding PadR family transcriptional regulator